MNKEKLQEKFIIDIQSCYDQAEDLKLAATRRNSSNVEERFDVINFVRNCHNLKEFNKNLYHNISSIYEKHIDNNNFIITSSPDGLLVSFKYKNEYLKVLNIYCYGAKKLNKYTDYICVRIEKRLYEHCINESIKMFSKNLFGKDWMNKKHIAKTLAKVDNKNKYDQFFDIILNHEMLCSSINDNYLNSFMKSNKVDMLRIENKVKRLLLLSDIESLEEKFKLLGFQ